MLTIGRTIWQHPSVQKEIKSWFNRFFYWPYTPTSDWHDFIQDLQKKFREQTPALAQHLQRELSHVIKSMGVELLAWLNHVKRMNNEYYRRLCRSYWETIDCPSSIHWTCHGRIDVRKTVEESWLKQPREHQLCATYHMAVRYGIDEVKIHQLWNSMSELQKWCYNGLNKEEYAVNVYYEKHRENKLDRLKDDIEANKSSFRTRILYNDRLNVEENVFLIFLAEGYTGPAELIWSRLDELARDRVLEDAAILAFDSWRLPVRNYDDFMSRQWADFSIFLISRMNIQQKLTFVGLASDLLRMFATSWPWNQFFPQVFEELWTLFGNDGNYESLLFHIAKAFLSEDVKVGYKAEDSKYQKIFQWCWRRLPSEVKLQLKWNLSLTLSVFIEARDMSTARLILKSPEVVDKKVQLLNFSKYLFEEMLVNNEWELLDKFMNDHFEDDGEKNTFKKSLMPHVKFILKGRFDLAEKCLDWQCTNEKEKNEVKMSIDYREFWESSNWYVRKFHVKAFLNWQCKSLKKGRNTMVNLDCKFARDTIYKLWIRWKSNVQEGKDKSTDFFEWFVKLENEIKLLKRERKIRETLITLLVEAMLNQNYYDIVDHLKCWCTLTVEEVKLVREMILCSSKIPICRHYIEAGEIQVSRGFLQWIENDEEKMKFVNHFVSNKGSTSCYRFIANDRSIQNKKKSKFQDFINCWIRPLEKGALSQFKRGVGFQAKKCKYKQPKDCKNYEIFQSLLNEMV